MSKTVVEEMVERIAADIFRGVYEPGERLPPYRKLAEAFDVTLPTAQRAVGRVHELGLLTVRQGSGAVVLDPATHASPAVLPYWLGAVADRPEVARTIVEDFLEVRRELATNLILRLRGGDEMDFEEVRAAIDAFESEIGSGDVDAYRACDLAVVRAMLAASPSIALATIFNSFADLLRRSPELTQAMYANPALNVVGYRGALQLILSDKPKHTIREAVIATMTPLDRATVERFEQALKETS